MGTVWHRGGNWRSRYSTLYSSRRLPLPKEEAIHRISFMNDIKEEYNDASSRALFSSLYSSSTKFLDSNVPSTLSQSMGTVTSSDYDTALLHLVRSKNHSHKKSSQTYKRMVDGEDNLSDEQERETCVHGLSIRHTERSISRSRVSRMSTRRDMDIPTILAFTTNYAPAAITIQMPEFKVETKPEAPTRQWSVRRSVCPVCSQKWRDRSAIANVKSSGLKKNSTADFPSVIAPARLRSSIISTYTPRPAMAAIDVDAGIVLGGWRHGNATWQLTRARKFRVLKPHPVPEIVVPSTAALEKKDLDNRVNRFLTD